MKTRMQFRVAMVAACAMLIVAWGIGQVRGLSEVWRALGGEWQSVPPGYARALARVVREG